MSLQEPESAKETGRKSWEGVYDPDRWLHDLRSGDLVMHDGLQVTDSDLDSPITFYLEKFKGLVPSDLKVTYDKRVDHCYSSAIPIIREVAAKKRNEVEHQVFATGFILNIAGRFFFITAAHVLDDRTQYPIGLGDGNDGPATLFNFEAPIYHSVFDKMGTRKGDNDDFGFAEIRNELALRILRGRRAITKDDLFPGGPSPKAWRAIVGYAGRQETWNGEVQPRSLLFTTRERSIEEAPTLGLSAEKHILLSREGRMVNLATGTRIKNLKFEGISGGPIWTIPTMGKLFSDNNKPKLCGMSVGGDQGNRFINGTRIGLIWNTVVQTVFKK